MSTVIRFFVAALALFAGSVSANQIVVDGSVSDYNSFTFRVPYETVVIPEGAPIDGKPIRLGQRRGLLVKFEPGATTPIQMVVQLQGGSVLHFSLRPQRGAPPAAWVQPGVGGRVATRPFSRPTDEWLVQTFQAISRGQVPDGFQPVNVNGLVGDFGGLQAKPLAAYATDGFKLLVARLRADDYYNLLPEDLYSPGVVSVMVDGDRVGPDYHPVAYVLIKTGT